jgi:hypothetical protein
MLVTPSYNCAEEIMYKLTCEICGSSFDAKHRRRHPHCQECAESLRSQGLGPIQISQRRQTQDDIEWECLKEAARRPTTIVLYSAVPYQAGMHLLYYLRRFKRYHKYDGITPNSLNTITWQDRELANQIAARMGREVWNSLVGASIECIKQLDLLHMTDTEWNRSKDCLRCALSSLFRPGIGVARLTKALHRKRPNFIPICDSVLLRAMKVKRGDKAEDVIDCMEKLRRLTQQDPKNLSALANLSKLCHDCGIQLSELRILEILHWVEFGPFKPSPQELASYTQDP